MAAKKSGTVEADEGDHPDAVHALVTPSEELGEIVGSEPMARGEVVSRIWDYIKTNKLQSDDDGREIVADEKLERVFGRKTMNMFEMNKVIAGHLR